jgi:proteasome accessory factor C
LPEPGPEPVRRKRIAPNTSQRLGRMLVVVPYLVQHPGSSLSEVAELFHAPADQLRRDLDLLFMSGLPPYGPGDLIDVEVDEDDRISIRMADHFARPLRLTRSEALAIYLRGTELMATPGLPEAPALAGALHKLHGCLGPEVEALARIEMAPGGVQMAPVHLDLLRGAARERHRLRIEYFAPSSGQWSRRTIEPEEVFSAIGNWYVAAWDVDSDAERLFRADRVHLAEDTGERFEPHGLAGAGRPLYSPDETDVAVRIRLLPAARWISEYYATTDPVEQSSGALDITLPVRRLRWAAALLLQVAPDAQVLEPPELVEEVRDLAERTIARYRY